MRGIPGVVAGIILAGSAHAGVYEDAQARYTHTDYAGAAAMLSHGSSDARSLELMGRCYLMDADFAAATNALERAVAADPGNSMTATWLGRAYGRRAETAFPLAAMSYAVKARQSFEKAVRLDSHNSEAINDLFEFYIQAPVIVGGGVDKARGLLPLIAQKDPAEAYFAQARIAEQNKDFSTAEVQLRRAVQLSPQSAGRNLDLARFLFKRGNFEESEKYFQQAETAAPLARKILFVRAECYIRAKRNLEQARDLLKRYLAAKDLTPDDPPRTAALKLLRQSEGM